jgi:molybdopterin-containing oxidoreductase family membrane subunit
MTPRIIGVVAHFDHFDRFLEAVRQLRASGFDNLRVASPVPRPEFEEALGRRESPVRVFTLVGAIVGGILGLGLTINTSIGYPLITGGKPIVSMPAFIVIAFELTILFGAIGTLLGLLILARVPRLHIGPAYHRRFSEDQFGLFVFCEPEQIATTSRIFREAGAVEVRNVEA